MERKFNKDSFDDDIPRGSRPFRRDDDKKKRFNGPRSGEGKPFRPKRRFDDEQDEFRPKRSFKGDHEKPFGKRRDNDRNGRSERRFDKPGKHGKPDNKRRRRDVTADSEILTEIVNRRKLEGRQSPKKQKILSLEFEEQHGPIRLNKYIANAGICSRRDADVLIASGAITVNGEVVTEMGHKVMPTDEVRYGDKVLQREKPVYVLLNKPKDYITTTDDERGRDDVMQLVRDACEERIYPVGRLDRDTTGLLLFTNDGDLTKKLTHPSSQIEKTYYVELDKNFANIDMAALRNGLELNDGVIIPDQVEYVDDSRQHIGVTIHSGKNRIVRRMFEFLGYEVLKLDRVVFAGLTKKDLPRGNWRYLTKKEVAFLKMLSKNPHPAQSQE
ncbi:MAG: rRNA pseudouridine synthase [Bacteroidales bacterium]|nr:rRNA pseudouridine synthase [Bacteroidales bacterium]